MNTTAAYCCARHFGSENLQIVFRTKEDIELRLAHWLFRLTSTSTLTRIEGATIGEWLKLGLLFKVLATNSVYRQFWGGKTVQEAQQAIQMLKAARIQTTLDHAAKCRATEEGFDKVQEEVLRNIALAAQVHSFSLICIKLTNLGQKEIFQKLTEGAPLMPEEQSTFARTEQRLDAICKAAVKTNITLYIDAEESWLQGPIDALAEKMMLRYNSQRAVVFNTLQMYRTDRLDYLSSLLQRLKGKRVMAGIKLVRGAYHEKERERAIEYGYTSPVFSLKEETDHSYKSAIDICLDNLPYVAFCAATHNQYSTKINFKNIKAA